MNYTNDNDLSLSIALFVVSFTSSNLTIDPVNFNRVWSRIWIQDFSILFPGLGASFNDS